ncbi:MAG TPA: cupredoxin domain-containing protein [Nitrososphaeraceae archaeon]|nr:cupredoxin domain-containing protein [Nitrososphaeraceae archaeon]
MTYKIPVLAISLLIVSGFILLPNDIFDNQIVAETDPTIQPMSMADENTSDATSANSSDETIDAASAISSNDTIILDAAEVGEEVYRWVNSTGAENPDLNLKLNVEYTVKIENPTDEEHELIIDSDSDGRTEDVAESPEIEPRESGEFKFTVNQVGQLGYHCEYHPDQMNGTITVS